MKGGETMKNIDLQGDIKEQFRKEGLSYPSRKSNGKYGLGGSTLLDRYTEKESLDATIKYLQERNIITTK
jgi:hypothetical protein